jgi:hypothetical protein
VYSIWADVTDLHIRQHRVMISFAARHPPVNPKCCANNERECCPKEIPNALHHAVNSKALKAQCRNIVVDVHLISTSASAELAAAFLPIALAYNCWARYHFVTDGRPHWEYWSRSAVDVSAGRSSALVCVPRQVQGAGGLA